MKVSIKKNNFISKWDQSYSRGENNILFPSEEVVKFLNRYIKKKKNLNGDYENILKNKFSKKLKALDFGCGAGRQTILLSEFDIKGYGLDISKFAINMAKKNAISLGYRELVNNFYVIENKRIPFKNNFFDFSIVEASLDSMPFSDAKEIFKEIKRVTKKYIYFSLISSGDKEYNSLSKEVIVRKKLEKESIQSYFNKKKILKLIDSDKSKLIYLRKKIEKGINENFFDARYYCIFKKK